MTTRTTARGTVYESAFAEWWSDESVGVACETRLAQGYPAANLATVRRNFSGSAFGREAMLVEGRAKPGYEMAEERSMQRFAMGGLLASYAMGVDLDELAYWFRELVTGVIADHQMLTHGDDGLALLSWNAMIGNEETTEILRPLIHNRVYTDFSPNLFVDLFFSAETVSSSPFRTHEKVPSLALRHVGLAKAYEAQASGDEVTAAKLVYDYVEKQWLPNHEEAFELTNHEKPSFIGYWAYEAAAVARVAGIDDSSLNGHRYYPYDLAHHLPSK